MDLAGAHEIALRLGVSRQRAYRIIATYDDFPRPVAELGIGRVWRMADVERWIRKHPERPTGRPSRKTGR